MQIAQELSGYTLGGADLLRRAMGKKIQAEMDKQRKIFVEGAVGRGVPKEKANDIFDQVNKFAGYRLQQVRTPAAYALVAYQTAYLKANHPVAFMAATMTLDMHNTDKLAAFRQELDRLGIPLLPPDVKRLGARFQGRRPCGPLRAGRDPQCRARRDGSRGRRAREERPVRRPVRFCRPHRPAHGQQAAVGKPGPRRGVRPPGEEPAARSIRAWNRWCARPRPPPRTGPATRSTCSAAKRPRPTVRICPKSPTGRPWNACARSSRPSASTCRPTRWTPTARA